MNTPPNVNTDKSKEKLVYTRDKIDLAKNQKKETMGN